MILVGCSWVLFWLLVHIFNVEVFNAVLVVGVVFILLGLVLGERPWVRRP